MFMRLFLQNLLIFFAIALCGLISFQWVRETDLRRTVQKQTDTIQDKLELVQNLQSAVKRDEAEIQRLDGLKTQLTQQVKSNALEIAGLYRELEKGTNELERTRASLEGFKDALTKANDNIRRQNEDIKKQNEEMAKLAEERNEVVKKFNKAATDYNDLAAKWNNQQEELAKANAAMTNAAAGKK